MKTRIAHAAKHFAALAISGVCALSLAFAPAAAYATSADGSSVQAQTQAQGIPAITGVTQLQPDAITWDILRFGGDYDQPLYYNLSRQQPDGAVKYYLQGSEYTVKPTSIESGLIANIVTMNMLDLLGLSKDEGTSATPAAVFGAAPSNAAPFSIAVYPTAKDAKFGTNALFDGALYPVYAKLVGQNGADTGYSILGIRTAATTEAAALAVGQTFYEFDDSATVAEGADHTPAAPLFTVYALQSPIATFSNNAFLVTYTEAGTSDSATSYMGSITYVDQEGNVVKVVDVPGLKPGEMVDATIQRAFAANQKYWRVINQYADTVQLSMTNSNVIVPVVEAKAAPGVTPFEVTFNYLNEEGVLLWSDSFDVLNTQYAYSLPDTFSMSSTSGVNLYKFKGVEKECFNDLFSAEIESAKDTKGTHTAIFDSDAVKLLDPETGNMVVNVIYESQNSEGKVDFTIKSIDGVSGETLETEKIAVTPANTPENPAVYTPEARFEYADTTYVPWGGNANPMSFTWDSLADAGTMLMQYVYYVPEDYVADEVKTVTVQYMNIANSSVIKTEAITVEPDSTTNINITGPETFSVGPDQYIRLAGQESPIKHSYFTPVDTYTIYYRNVNDVLNAQTIITRTQVIDTVRVTVIPGTFTTGVTATPAAGADGMVDAGVTAGDGTTIINDDNNPLTTLDGTDTSTERVIDDDATPLAGAEGAGVMSPALAVALGIGLLAALIAAIAFLVVRRRKANGKTDTKTAA